MRWPRWRFTIRRLMLLVAALALILGAELARRRSRHFAALALSYARQEEFDRFLLDGGSAILRTADGKVVEIRGPSTTRVETGGGGLLVYEADPTPGYEAGELQARAARHALLRRKYERAARHPWLPVEPDPPGLDRSTKH